MTDVLTEEVEPETDGPEDIEDFLTEIPVHGLLAPEGVPTGDSRMFEPGAMSSRDLPYPLRYEFVGSHGGDTSHVATVGRVDKVWRDGSNVMWSGVVATMKPYSDEVIASIADGTARGVSVDGDEATASRIQVPVGDTGEFREVVSYSEIRSSGLTIVPIPAYQESYISFGSTPEEALTAAAALEDCGCDEKGAFDLDGEAFTAMQDTPGTDENLPDPEDRTGALIVLVPDANDPVVAASSEEAHLTFIWMGDLDDGVQMDPDAVIAAVQEYAANATPIIVPVRERGLLGDEDADVVFLEPTESLVAFRDGLLENPVIQAPYAAAEQFDEWTPHVTLGYPEGVENGPASGEYSGTEVTFAGIAVWLGAERVAFPLGEPLQDNPGEVDQDDDLEFSGGTETFAPGTKDGPGWITHPKPTARIRQYWVSGAGAAKIKWGVPGDFNRCRAQLAKYVPNPNWLAGLCANMHFERLKAWPGRELARGASAITASADGGGKPSEIVTFATRAPEQVYDASWFKHPTFAGPTGMRIDRATGRVWGHLAAWGVCHIGIPGICQTAPRSRSNYAMFKTGRIETTEGAIRVGKLTSGIGHANLKVRMARAVAHYDKTSAVRAFVNVGEDAHGIWFAGILNPNITERQLAEFWAVGSLSGDWRTVAGSLEMIACVAVSSPGFPIPEPEFTIDRGVQVALTGAGAIPFSAEAVISMEDETRTARRKAVAASVRSHTVADLRTRLNQE